MSVFRSIGFIGNRDGYTIVPQCARNNIKAFWKMLRDAGYTDNNFYSRERPDIEAFAETARKLTCIRVAVCECLH